MKWCQETCFTACHALYSQLQQLTISNKSMCSTHIGYSLCSCHDHCRVLNAIRYWVEHHYYDFHDDASLLEDLMAFLVTIKGNNLKKWIESIHRTLQRQVCIRRLHCVFLWRGTVVTLVMCGCMTSVCMCASAWWTWHASTDGCGVLQQCSGCGVAPLTEPRWLWPRYGRLLLVLWHVTHWKYVCTACVTQCSCIHWRLHVSWLSLRLNTSGMYSVAVFVLTMTITATFAIVWCVHPPYASAG